MNGLTYNSLWLIETDLPGRPGTILYSLPQEGFHATGWPGMLQLQAHPFKVIEVTSDKLIISLYPLGTSLPDKIYEFHRIK